MPRRKLFVDGLEARALELERRVAALELTKSHNRVSLSTQIFEKIRVLGMPPTSYPSLKSSIPLFPLDLLFPETPTMGDVESREQFGAVFRPELPRSALERLFINWNPREGTSPTQSLYLCVLLR